MSRQADCPSCLTGIHDRHDPKWNIREGLIGGEYCGCSGDCAKRAKAAFAHRGKFDRGRTQVSEQNEAAKHLFVGAIWRRRKTGALVRITRLHNHASSWSPNPYYDISWETVEKPVRRGQSYEDYWLKNCEPTAETTAGQGGAG